VVQIDKPLVRSHRRLHAPAARANRHTAQCALDEYSLIGTAVSRDAVVALKQGTGVALLVTGCRKQPLSGPA